MLTCLPQKINLFSGHIAIRPYFEMSLKLSLMFFEQHRRDLFFGLTTFLCGNFFALLKLNFFVLGMCGLFKKFRVDPIFNFI